MDFLAVAAAAGGYVAKYLHKMSKENGEASSSDSTNAVQGRQQRGKTNALNDTANGCDGSYTDLRSFGNIGRKRNLGEESTVMEGLQDFGRYQDCNPLSLASLPPIPGEKEMSRLGDGDELVDSSRALMLDSGLGEVQFAQRLPGRRSIRSRRPYNNFAKPISSFESCLTAQLYEQHFEMESYVRTPFPSPSTRTRPLLVTDGKRVISRASPGFQADLPRGGSKIEDKILLGAPTLPKMPRRISNGFKKRLKQNNGEQCCRKLSSSVPIATGLFSPQGSHNGMLLFLVGATIGILSSAVANKREVDRLNELLKQSRNLVQDLQEEIEMKESMTVKELVNEKVSLQESYENIVALDDPTTRAEISVDDEACSKRDDGTAKQSEIMSQIEAELEAELERLELNLRSSTLEKIADYVELDPDYEADFTKGEFRLDTITKQRNEDSESDIDVEGTGHTDYANRPVSPRDLSLRLHKVIEGRLEARIKELELALADSQKRVCSLENSSIIAKTCGYKESTSPQNSSSVNDQNNFDQPLVINLGGDALDAYNEAYEEIFRMVKTEDETPPDTEFNKNAEEPRTTMPSKSSVSQNMYVEERSPLPSIQRIDWQENLEHDSGLGDESEDDDILGKLLIQQIVEKTRQGSPLVLNAQRLLNSMDE